MPTVDTGVLFLIAMFNFGTALLGWFTYLKVRNTDKNMETVEKATNSMKDALVASTAKASFAEGKAIGKDEQDVSIKVAGKGPIAVTDERTAVAAEKTANAAEKQADATSRIASAAEDLKK